MVNYCEYHQILTRFMYQQTSQKEVLQNTGWASCILGYFCKNLVLSRPEFLAQRFFTVSSNQQSYVTFSWTCSCRCSPHSNENGSQACRFGLDSFLSFGEKKPHLHYFLLIWCMETTDIGNGGMSLRLCLFCFTDRLLQKDDFLYISQ